MSIVDALVAGQLVMGLATAVLAALTLWWSNDARAAAARAEACEERIIRRAASRVPAGARPPRPGPDPRGGDPGPPPALVRPATSGSPFPGLPGYVVGMCGHRMSRSEWDAGYSSCEGCDGGNSLTLGLPVQLQLVGDKAPAVTR